MPQNINNPQPGDIFVAADGGTYGVIIAASADKVDDVNVVAFESKYLAQPYKIDAFKLTYRYKEPVQGDFAWIPQCALQLAGQYRLKAAGHWRE
jgi:hypothetical protein